MAGRAYIRAAIVAVVLAVAAMLAGGCGYHVAGKGAGVPEGMESLSIPFFTNRTGKADIEGPLTAAFVSEFVATVPVVDDGRAVMNGVITGYSLRAVSYTQSDVTQEYRLTVSMSIIIRSSGDDGVVIWNDDSITDYEDFTVDTADISATRMAETAAFEKLAKDTARKVKERIVEGF